MKKLFIIAILGTTLIFQNCAPKEKQEVTVTSNDSIVTETVLIDSVTTVNGTEVIVEEVATETEKTYTENPATVTKVTVKEPVKVVTPTKTVTKAGETTKTEVVTKVVVADEPKKVVVAETPVKVAVQEPKATASTSNWAVPAKYQTMKNPIDPKTDMAIGKSLYGKHCKSCHGSEGYGDGTKAKEMKGDLGDFSSKKFQSQTDGALFYKTTFGRNDMPAFNKKLPSNEDRWLIVNYMRTL
ncbi:MAG TPA: cytochrome c [Lutibacter sp.]|nr:cytochrome c [Lutibacter sp.]